MTSASMPSPAQLVGRGQRQVHHARPGDDGQVAAGPGESGPGRADPVRGPGRRRGLALVQQPVLDEDHRVVGVDGDPQQPVGVRDRERASPRSARGYGPAAPPGSASAGCRRTGRTPNWVRITSGRVTAPPVMKPQLGRLVHDLVQADAEEVQVHQLDDRAQPGHGGADRQAHHRRFRDRRVQHPVRATVRQAPGEPEHVAAARRRCRPGTPPGRRPARRQRLADDRDTEPGRSAEPAGAGARGGCCRAARAPAGLDHVVEHALRRRPGAWRATASASGDHRHGLPVQLADLGREAAPSR